MFIRWQIRNDTQDMNFDTTLLGNKIINFQFTFHITPNVTLTLPLFRYH